MIHKEWNDGSRGSFQCFEIIKKSEKKRKVWSQVEGKEKQRERKVVKHLDGTNGDIKSGRIKRENNTGGKKKHKNVMIHVVYLININMQYTNRALLRRKCWNVEIVGFYGN